jgi:hypothetical protein
VVSCPEPSRVNRTWGGRGQSCNQGLKLWSCRFESINHAIQAASRIAERRGGIISCASSKLGKRPFLRGVFLAVMGADEAQIEASFSEAIRIAKGQKSVSLEKTSRNNLRGIPPPKSKQVSRTWLPITSLMVSSNTAVGDRPGCLWIVRKVLARQGA